MNAKRSLLAATAIVLMFGSGYGVRVLAEGAPSEPSLFYAGTLERDGELASGTYTILLELYAAESGGDAICSIEREAEVESGRFRIDTSECADSLRENADAWVAVSFRGDDGIERAIAGRSKIGAVPYAFEADHALSASSATGALLERIDALAARLDELEGGAASTSAFHAIKTMDQPLTVGAATYITFDEERFDLGDEYDPETGEFTVKVAGNYEFSCTLSWAIGSHDLIGQYEAAIHVNDYEYLYNGFYGDGFATTRQVRAVIPLSAGDIVRCGSWVSDNTGGLHITGAFNSFEGRRYTR